jgi:nitroimidazol reductase NimA-like FMN-containing flavoprotein (pyridoxamine 5'-phosphate oxidase superfamily)
VDAIKDAFHWQSVLVSGHYEEITDPPERERILCALFARLPHLTPVESAMTGSTGLAETIIFRLRIETLTGVSEK